MEQGTLVSYTFWLDRMLGHHGFVRLELKELNMICGKEECASFLVESSPYEEAKKEEQLCSAYASLLVGSSI
jgi:hypothetical protein